MERTLRVPNAADRRLSRVLPLLFFPLLQAGLFILGCALIEQNPWAAALAVLLAGLALDFSVHVCLHEFLHRSEPEGLPAVANVVFTWVAGLPYDGYRLHHQNHHRYENSQDDYSSTLRQTEDGLVPMGLIRYALLWPLQVGRSTWKIRAASPLRGARERARRRTLYQNLALLVLYVSLALVSWKLLVAYLSMIYVGWALISVHNYGQHPPVQPAVIPSYASRLYNLFTFNNGLHYEHHAEPSKPWHELLEDPEAARIESSHLLVPLRFGQKTTRAHG